MENLWHTHGPGLRAVEQGWGRRSARGSSVAPWVECVDKQQWCVLGNGFASLLPSQTAPESSVWFKQPESRKKEKLETSC